MPPGACCYNSCVMMSAGLGSILIVDDEQSVREVLSEYFTEQGYAVETAGGGEEALAVVQRSTPDLVLLDVRMPGIDGVETLRRMRGIAPEVSVIMVTANEDVGLARETLNLGALDYVAKPFDFVYLERAIMAGLAQSGAAGLPLTAEASSGPWTDLARAVFHAVRGMASASRASTGARLEDAVLAAAREASLGRADVAGAFLGEIELLLTLAAELRDLSDAQLPAIQSALAQARQALGAGR
jgi:two-component system response regulator (stage 0 sporulation protein F)